MRDATCCCLWKKKVASVPWISSVKRRGESSHASRVERAVVISRVPSATRDMYLYVPTVLPKLLQNFRASKHFFATFADLACPQPILKIFKKKSCPRHCFYDILQWDCPGQGNAPLLTYKALLCPCGNSDPRKVVLKLGRHRVIAERPTGPWHFWFQRGGIKTFFGDRLYV